MGRIFPGAGCHPETTTGAGWRALGGAADRGGLWHFHQSPRFYVVDVAVDRNVGGNQRVRSNPGHVVGHTLGQVIDRQPSDELTGLGTGPIAGIMPAGFVDRGRFYAAGQQARDCASRKGFHAAVRVLTSSPA